MSIELDYLLLAAHPDDAELFCGGSLIKLRQRGYKVGVADLTRAEAGTAGSVEERAREAAAASKILDLSFRTNLGLPDGRLEDNMAARQAVVEVIRETKAKVLIASWGPCRHPDHTAAHNLARNCYFFAGNGKFPSELPPWRPLRVIYYLELHDIRPSFVIDISEQFETKMKALQGYVSQFYSPESGEKPTFIGSKDFMAKLAARFAYYGSLINCRYGEPYIVDGTLRLDDPLKNHLEG